jgi:hypothetical protein
VEIISPLGGVPTYAWDNKNGFLSSVLAWLKGSTGVAGGRELPGYRVWYRAMLDHMPGVVLPEECKAALTEAIACDNRTERIWDSWNQTCLKEPATGKYCGEVIDRFNKVSSVEQMPGKYLCSFCWIHHYALALQSQFSNYDEFIQSQPKYATSRCNQGSLNTTIPNSPIVQPDTSAPFCQSGNWYRPQQGDTCDSIAQSHSVASGAQNLENPTAIFNCSSPSSFRSGAKLCLPLPCSLTWTLPPGDSCTSIEYSISIATNTSALGNVEKHNRWVDRDCSNLHSSSDAAGAGRHDHPARQARVHRLRDGAPVRAAS